MQPARQGRDSTAVTFAVEQEVLHVVAEGDVHVAAVELAGQAAAVERRDRVRAVRGGKTATSGTATARQTFACSETSTCTGVAAWGRPPC